MAEEAAYQAFQDCQECDLLGKGHLSSNEAVCSPLQRVANNCRGC